MYYWQRVTLLGVLPHIATSDLNLCTLQHVFFRGESYGRAFLWRVTLWGWAFQWRVTLLGVIPSESHTLWWTSQGIALWMCFPLGSHTLGCVSSETRILGVLATESHILECAFPLESHTLLCASPLRVTFLGVFPCNKSHFFVLSCKESHSADVLSHWRFPCWGVLPQGDRALGCASHFKSHSLMCAWPLWVTLGCAARKRSHSGNTFPGREVHSVVYFSKNRTLCCTSPWRVTLLVVLPLGESHLWCASPWRFTPWDVVLWMSSWFRDRIRNGFTYDSVKSEDLLILNLRPEKSCVSFPLRKMYNNLF